MWVRLESNFFTNKKAEGLDDHCIALYFRALCRAGSNLTDGRLSLTFIHGKRQAGYADQLILVGLWHRAKGLEQTCPKCWQALKGNAGDGYVIHDYLEYNFSKDEVDRRFAVARSVRVAGGLARAASASRGGGRFLPADDQQRDQQTTSRDHQQRSVSSIQEETDLVTHEDAHRAREDALRLADALVEKFSMPGTVNKRAQA